jgi:predicted regulator of Ras-like GTPase activity (Roadblock/LC7/MglB family)
MSLNMKMDLMFQQVQKDLSNLKGVKKSMVASQDGYILSQPAESRLELFAKTSAAMLKPLQKWARISHNMWSLTIQMRSS